MFTGIVEGARPIVAVAEVPGGRKLTVDLPDAGEPIALGESVALDGVCLTVATADGRVATFDVIAETLRRTTLGRRRVGDLVNVERALRPADRLGGHFVQGHVDGTAVLAKRNDSPREVVLEFQAEAALIDEMLPKGSIAIDGVSLTLVDVDRAAARFRVALIPTTLAVTTLARRREGDSVNIETDLIGKWVRRYLADVLGGASAGGVTMDKLREAGFV